MVILYLYIFRVKHAVKRWLSENCLFVSVSVDNSSYWWRRRTGGQQLSIMHTSTHKRVVQSTCLWHTRATLVLSITYRLTALLSSRSVRENKWVHTQTQSASPMQLNSSILHVVSTYTRLLYRPQWLHTQPTWLGYKTSATFYSTKLSNNAQ